MRLTLRTLLAWLDGVLPDDEQQQLGAKVSSSTVATHLVERIRTAVGRTAIGAPRPDGKGLTEDPNSVAEYLDNTLSAEQLEAFERICIESEVHLAEVAACHGLLAEVARDPAAERGLHQDERERIQQRLRGLLAGIRDRAVTERDEAQRRGDDHRESRETARAIRDALDAAPSHNTAATPAGEIVVPLAPGRATPLPAKRSSSAAWVAALVSLALLVALAGTLAWSLLGTPAGRGSRRPTEVARVEQPEPVVPPVENAETPPAHEAAETTVAAEAAAEPMSLEQTANVPEEQSPESPAPELSHPDEPAPEASDAEAPGLAATGRATDSAIEVVEIPLPVTEAPDPAFAATDSPDPVGLVGGEGGLLRQSAASEWSFVPVGSALGKREDLLVLRGFQPELQVRGVTIRLLPQTRAVLSLDTDGTPRIEVVFGRAVAQASRADTPLGITAVGLVGTVTAGLVSPVAVEVELNRDPGTDPTSTPPLVRSRVYASRGLAWRQTAGGGLPAERLLEGIDAQGMLDERMSLEWSSAEPSRISPVRNRVLPPWVGSGSRPDRLEKTASEALAAKLAAATPLTKALHELAIDKRTENRTLAASALALIGDFDDLVEQLAAEAPGKKLEARQWSQLEAATVPLALARGGNAASRLFESIVNRGPRGKADALKAMALGFTDQDLAAGADRGLVDALEDPSLIVRRYAIQSLVEVTQPSAVDRARYRPDGLPEMRQDGVLWWRGQLEKGLIRRSPRAVGTAAPAADKAAPMAEEE